MFFSRQWSEIVKDTNHKVEIFETIYLSLQKCWLLQETNTISEIAFILGKILLYDDLYTKSLTLPIYPFLPYKSSFLLMNFQNMNHKI